MQVQTTANIAGMEAFKAMLKKHSLKATNQRLAVHEVMLRLGHASADMVTEELEKSGESNVTVASVYNILTGLAEKGIYRHRMSSNNKMYFDVNTFKHIHLYDCVNHTYKDIMDDDLMELINLRLARKKFRGYSVQDIDIQIVVHPTKNRKKPKMV